ncbi:hypothetical protein CGRA01v4_13177 [Colletotrichum graminicola]|nr:hypothetical protein CGRA01v4_13177 [Colletotrichum graminicola]
METEHHPPTSHPSLGFPRLSRNPYLHLHRAPIPYRVITWYLFSFSFSYFVCCLP